MHRIGAPLDRHGIPGAPRVFPYVGSSLRGLRVGADTERGFAYARTRMRRYIPALLLALAAFAPFPLAGCTDLVNKLKGNKGEDASAEAAVAATPDPEADAAEPAETATATAPTTTTLATATATTTAAKPVDAGSTDAAAKADAAVADAGAVATDAGAKTDGGPAPAPTPTLKIPNLFDGGGIRFDAGGGFKPPIWNK